jgi:putative ABC transport system ATP-binding protein
MKRNSNLGKQYRTDLVETVTLNKMSFEVINNECVAILRPSNFLKSTLLIILGLFNKSANNSFLFKEGKKSDFSDNNRYNMQHVQNAAFRVVHLWWILYIGALLSTVVFLAIQKIA